MTTTMRARLDEIKNLVDTAIKDGVIPSTTSTKDALSALIEKRKSAYNAHITSEAPTMSATVSLNDKLQEAVSAYVDLATLTRLGELEKVNRTDPVKAFTDYLSSHSVNGCRVKQVKDSPTLDVDMDKAKAEVDFYDFLQVCRPSELNGIMDGITIIMDNIAKFELKSEDAHITRKSISADYASRRKRMGWDKYDSRTALIAQLNELVNKYIMPKGSEEIKMISADLKYISREVLKVTRRLDKEGHTHGTFVLKQEKSIAAFIFTAIYHRKNKIAYDFQGLNAHSANAKTLSNGNSTAKKDEPKSGEAKPTGNTTTGTSKATSTTKTAKATEKKAA